MISFVHTNILFKNKDLAVSVRFQYSLKSVTIKIL